MHGRSAPQKRNLNHRKRCNSCGTCRKCEKDVGPIIMTARTDAFVEPAHSSLEADARRLAGALDARSGLVLVLLTAVYLLGAVFQARSKPLWYDEIISTIAAGAPDAATTWRVAQQTDFSPPLPHLLIHFSMNWFGANELGARVPAIAGFWMFCLCLYRFTRRRVGLYYALAAMLLPVSTDAYGYAFEARAYGPELAFCGLALIAWQACTENARSWLPRLGLAIGLAGATLCHYYAILLYLPLAGGELTRCFRTRRADWGTWIAMAGGAIGIGWRATTLVGILDGNSHPWAVPESGQIMQFWESGLRDLTGFLVLLTGLLAIFTLGAKTALETPEPADGVADHELVAGALFLAIPTVAVAGALSITHMFTPRYALFALAGFAYLLPMLASRLLRTHSLFGLLLTCVLIAPLALHAVPSGGVPNPYLQEPMLAKASADEPVVIPDGRLFLQMWYYAPANVKSRLLYVTDRDAAIKYMGFDSIDYGLMLLRPWTSARIIEYRSFFAPGRRFLVYQNMARPEWLLHKVVEEGGTAEIQSYSRTRALLQTRFRP